MIYPMAKVEHSAPSYRAIETNHAKGSTGKLYSELIVIVLTLLSSFNRTFMILSFYKSPRITLLQAPLQY